MWVLQRTLVLAIAIGVSLFVFRDTLHAGFTSDDLTIWNEISKGKPFNLFTDGALGAKFFRPMVPAFLWLANAVVGPDPTAFHVIILVIQGITAGILFFVARQASLLFGLNKDRGFSWWVAGIIGGLYFVFLRTHTEAINWLSSIGDVLGTFFGAIALYAYLRFRNFPSASVRTTKRSKWDFLLVCLAFLLLALLCKEASIGFLLVLLALEWVRLPGFALPVSVVAILSMPISYFRSGEPHTVAMAFAMLGIVSLLILVQHKGEERLKAAQLDSFGIFIPIGLAIALLSNVLLALVRTIFQLKDKVWLLITDFHPYAARIKREVQSTSLNKLKDGERTVWFVALIESLALMAGCFARELKVGLDESLLSGMWKSYRAEYKKRVQSHLLHFAPAVSLVLLFSGYWIVRTNQLGTDKAIGGWGDSHTNFSLSWLKKTVPLHFNNASFGFPSEWPFGLLAIGVLTVVFVVFALKHRRQGSSPVPTMVILGIPLTLLCLMPAMPLPVMYSGENERFGYMPSFFFSLFIGSTIAALLPEILALIAGVSILVPHYLALQIENPRWKAAADTVQGIYQKLDAMGCTKVRRLYVLTSVDYIAGQNSVEGVPLLFKTSFIPGFNFHFPKSQTQVGVGQLVLAHRKGDVISVSRVSENVFEITTRTTFKPPKIGEWPETQYMLVSPERNGMFGGRSSQKSATLELVGYDRAQDAIVYIDGEDVFRL